MWAKNDPFWNTNQSGSLWNCKCDWQETDEPVTDGNPSNKRIVNQGLEGNPAITGEIFTDNASYIKHAGGSTDIEKQCKGANRDYCIDYAKHTYKSPFVCNISEQNLMLDLSSQHANKHFAKDLYEDDIFWLKNEILINPNILKDSTYIGYKECDKEHNTSKKNS
ncbi:MAG: hypothetical protein MJZ71_06585 [Bacteroidales bacterium]|nr:hypothetical protein [Bacteroidales bacterium]